LSIHKILDLMRQKAENELGFEPKRLPCEEEQMHANNFFELLKDTVCTQVQITSDVVLRPITELHSEEENTEDFQFEEIEDEQNHESFIVEENEEVQLENTSEIEDISLEIDPHEISFEQSQNCFEINRSFYNEQYMKKAVECFDRYGFKRVCKRFKKIKNPCYISRFRKCLQENETTRREKLIQLQQRVKARWDNALQKREIVHDYDIRRWGIHEAKLLGISSFKASNFWLHSFKKKHRIVSRKITKFATDLQVENPEVLARRAHAFNTEVKEEAKTVQLDQIFNSDQSGFNYLLKSSRMHAVKGEKIVMAHTQSVSKQTHSYTVQPTISMAGKLVGKIYICFQEKDGVFGPRVQSSVDEMMEKCKNVYVSCSKSGKLTKDHVREWVKQCLEPIVEEKCILLLDSWSGQKDGCLYDDLGDKECVRMTIPEKTTGICQPLDVYGFRQVKIFVRKITSVIVLDELGLDITTRSNIIQMHSLIFNQLACSIFQNMWLYAWWKSGYSEVRPESFLNVSEALFELTMNGCQDENCDEPSFIRCAYCRNTLCFNHFFVSYHIHEDAES